jgi:primosomal protein N' (replication factor Y)
VFIQLFNTQHPVIQFVQSHDFNGYVRHELESRKEFQYPPFTRLIRITLKHKNQQTVQLAAQHLSETLINLPKTILFGPAEPAVGRIRNYYLQEILLKMNRDTSVIKEIKLVVKQQIVSLHTTKNYSNVIVQIDVDPY